MGAEIRNNNALSSQALLKKISKGDRSAEEALVAKYERGLIYILNRQSRDPDLSADIAQETLITVIEKARAGEVRDPDALAGFIHQVGTNMLIGHFRKENRRKTDTESEMFQAVAEDHVKIPESVSSNQIFVLVEQLINELPVERDRELLRRYFVYDQDKLILCQEFDLSPIHFDRVLYRARDRLKQLLQHKLNLDISQVSIAHIVSIGFMALLFSAFFKLYPVLVGETPLPYHPINITEFIEGDEFTSHYIRLYQRGSHG